MNINDILKKLKYKDGYRALLLNSPSVYGEAAGKLGFELQAGASKYDLPFYLSVTEQNWINMESKSLTA